MHVDIMFSETEHNKFREEWLSYAKCFTHSSVFCIYKLPFRYQMPLFLQKQAMFASKIETYFIAQDYSYT